MVRQPPEWGELQTQWSAGGDSVFALKSSIWRRFSAATVPAPLCRPLQLPRPFRTRPLKPYLNLLRKSELCFLPTRKDSVNLAMKKFLYLRSTFLDSPADWQQNQRIVP